MKTLFCSKPTGVTLELWGSAREWKQGPIMNERSPWNQVVADHAQSETIKY